MQISSFILSSVAWFLAYFGQLADFRRLYIGFSAVSTRQKTWRKTDTIKMMSEDQKTKRDIVLSNDMIMI